MPRLTRRNYIQGTLATALATPAAGASPVRKPAPGKPGIKLALMLSPGGNSKTKLAPQLGVNHAIVGVGGVLGKVRREQYYDELLKVKQEFEAAGLTIAGVESHPVPAEKIKLGIEGRDEEIENYKAAIDALSKVGVRMICYNFMAGLGWYRTKVDLRGRGGALVTEFSNETAMAQGITKWGEVSEDKMWDNIGYFLREVIPVAEKAGVAMALHPDDPPLSPLRGIARIVISARNYRRIMDTVPSRVNGITYCQANFVAMGEDIEKLAREWLAQKKIFFVHFRDIAGKGERFVETFHDNGPTDMPRMLQVYHEGGFNGPMRPDHAPTLEGDQNDRPGYAVRGKIFAIGYMKGIMDGIKIPYA